MRTMLKMNIATGALALALLSGAAHAQEAAEANGSSSEADAVEEIVVTAQKRSERAQDVPISIAAFSEKTLTTNNVLSVQDLGRITTNFSATRASQASSIRLSVRGVGAPGNTATEPSVAAFIDGVYVPRPGSIIGNFLDIEGVEVLRGPQGTLFGRNASVGAISFRSASPKDEFSGQISAEAGNGDRYKLSGHVNLPLSETVALRVAGLGSWFKGYWHNRLDGKTYGGSDDYAGRVSLKADFDNISWIVRADYSKANGDGFVPAEFRFDSITSAQAAAFAAIQTTVAGSSIDTNLYDRTINQRIAADYMDRHWGISSDATLDLGGYSLRMINSYRDWNSTQTDGDTIFTTMPLSTREGGFTSKSQNHEIQFISPKDELLGGRLDFVAGLYYFQEDYTIDERLQANAQYCNVLVPAGAQRTACNTSLAAGGGVDATDQDFSQSVESYAIYGQTTLKILDPLSLTLGGRWSSDDKTASYVQKRAFPFAAALRAIENADLALKDNRFTWRASLNYKPNRDLLFFMNYSTGYKSGGFNSGAGATALNQLRIFNRETVKNYEIGAKTSWLDDALVANLTLYRMDIGGFQDRAFDGVSFVVRNAGSLRHQGFEFDTTIRPVPNFTVNASLAYLDSKFTNYPGGAGLPGCATGPAICASLPNNGRTQDLKGLRLNFTPEFTGNVGATWTGDIGNSGLGWSLNGNIALTSDMNNGGVNDGNRQTVQDGYALVGARFGMNGPDDRWNIAVFGSNLTNEGYCNSQFYQVLDTAFGMRNGVFPGSTGVRCNVANPRTYGVSGSFRF